MTSYSQDPASDEVLVRIKTCFNSAQSSGNCETIKRVQSKLLCRLEVVAVGNLWEFVNSYDRATVNQALFAVFGESSLGLGLFSGGPLHLR